VVHCFTSVLQRQPQMRRTPLDQELATSPSGLSLLLSRTGFKTLQIIFTLPTFFIHLFLFLFLGLLGENLEMQPWLPKPAVEISESRNMAMPGLGLTSSQDNYGTLFLFTDIIYPFELTAKCATFPWPPLLQPCLT
jgi:hypothetical protein